MRSTKCVPSLLLYSDAPRLASLVAGVDLSKTPALLGLVESVDGLNRSEIEAMLESNEHSESVMAKDEKYKRGGVSGVPFFFIGGYKFSGAQPPEVFEEIINEMLDES